jgi:hypothetical protein
MTTVTTETISLLNADWLDKSPPCNIYPGSSTPPGTKCGKESVVRIAFSCSVCGNHAIRFLCQPHYDDLKVGNFCCTHPRALAGHGYDWKVI